RVKDAAAARAWLRTAPVTTAAPLDPPPTTALQVAFTAPGLKTLGVAESALAGFSSEFVAGMTPDARARRLGDVGANASSQWDWGGTSAVPHLAVMLFAEPGGLAGLEQRTTGGTWTSAFDLLRRLHTGDLGGREPFGFADGISQPEIDWEQRRDPPKAQ